MFMAGCANDDDGTEPAPTTKPETATTIHPDPTDPETTDNDPAPAGTSASTQPCTTTTAATSTPTTSATSGTSTTVVVSGTTTPETAAGPSTSAGTVSLISNVPCDDVIPIDSMPDGRATTEPLIDGDEVRWSSGDAGGAGDNIVIQLLDEPAADVVASARDSSIEFTRGPLTASVMLSQSVSQGHDIFVFDNASDCVRVISTSPFVPEDVVDEYAQTLLAAWTPA